MLGRRELLRWVRQQVDISSLVGGAAGGAVGGAVGGAAGGAAGWQLE